MPKKQISPKPAMLIPVSRDNLNNLAYAQIKNAIMAGYFHPGMQLSVRSLAHDLGTSPMPIRDALQRLAAEQALQITPQKKLRIPVLTPRRFDAIRRVRLLLEGAAMEDMAKVADGRDIAKLEALNASMTRAAKQPAKFLALNQEFHFFIYRLAGNEASLPMIESLWLQFGPTLNLVTNELGVNAATHHHAEIISALHDRAPARARKGLEADIDEAAALILGYMQSESAAGTREKAVG